MEKFYLAEGKRVLSAAFFVEKIFDFTQKKNFKLENFLYRIIDKNVIMRF